MVEDTLRILDRSLDEEVDAWFDDSSRSDPTAEVPRRFVLVAGTPVSGKTRLRRDRFTQGFVTVDAGDIFRRLEQGEIFDFPGEFEWMLDLIGPMVAERAIAERRHLVTEVFGSDEDEIAALLNQMKAVGYKTELAFVRSSAEQAEVWNQSRGPDNISSYFTDRFNVRWLTEAAGAYASAHRET
jgi:hypothetical protein